MEGLITQLDGDALVVGVISLLTLIVIWHGSDIIGLLKSRGRCNHQWKKLDDNVVTCTKCGDIKKL